MRFGSDRTFMNLKAPTEVCDVKICGFQKLAMVDYPGKLAATVFTGGCNLRCPFCHNALLVTRVEENDILNQKDVLDFLKSRQGLLDGVVLSGGEPLLHSGVMDFLKAVKELDYNVKLDTNGTFPESLAALLNAGLLDYVAMDIKNCPRKYPETVGVPGFDIKPVRESASILMNGKIPFEFRTTVVRELHAAEDLKDIGRWLFGAPRYFLQQFVDSGNLVGSGLTAYTAEELSALADTVRSYFGEVTVRGI